jgi:hypothetical protein
MIIATINRYPHPTLYVGPFPTEEALRQWCEAHGVGAGIHEIVPPDTFDGDSHRIWIHNTRLDSRA